MKLILNFTLFKKVITVFLLLLSATCYAQAVVTDIFPRRLTTGSKVTIIGTNFTSAVASSIVPNINSTNVTLVNSTEMNYTVTTTYDTSDGGDLNRVIGIGSASFASGVNGNFEFIAPANKTLSTSSLFGVKEIYTTWNREGDENVDVDGDGNVDGFWKSSDFNSSDSSTWPNDRHDLLGYKMNYSSGDIIFSTGVDDTLLEQRLTLLGVDVTDNAQYVSQEFKAYSSRGISGKPHSSNYLAMADKIDGAINGRVLNSSVLATVYDVIIDGVNGLDLGTGITNFNKDAEIKFYSGNGNVGAIDTTPDLLITQMAQPGGGGSKDVYYYSDVEGNVVGRPIKLQINDNSNTRLFKWRLDLYRLDQSSSVTYENSYPNQASYGTQEHRPFTMLAFKLQDFEIGTTNITDVNNINMAAGGSSDMAFMAYNKAAFGIKSPKIDDAPISRYFCTFPTVSDVTFDAIASVEGGYSNPANTNEIITYQWFENFASVTAADGTLNSFTLAAGLTEADIVNKIYKVRVENKYGAIDIPFTIFKGGTPTYWDGSDWVLASVYDGVTIADENKSLIFANDYSNSGDLLGCDCTVSAGKNVVIPSGSTMTLINTLTVEGKIEEFIENGNVSPAVPAAIFTIEDDASLVQINNVTNVGDINVKRIADNLHTYDYVYWSSPVADFDISNIPGNNKYEWHTNEGNANGTSGDWAMASGVMKNGRGYITRVPSAATFTTTFTGVPNNGTIDWDVFKTATTSGLDTEEQHWNLIGNPYPSALNAGKFLEDNIGIEGSVYLWTHSTPASANVDQPFYENFPVNYGDQYVAYNGTGSSSPSFDGNIASAQAFFVQVLDATDSPYKVFFTNDMRHNNLSTYDNSQFYRSSSEETVALEKQLIWLSLANEDNHAISTLIGYADGATEGKDRLYDAFTNNDGFNLYSLISEDEKLAIQGLSLPFVDTNIVPLGFELIESGIYKIAIGNLRGSLFVDQEQGVYLEDTYTDVIHDLRVSPYAFTSEAGEFNDRFVLRYTASSILSINDVSITNTFAYINDAILYVKSSNSIEGIEIFDMNGKQIINYTIKGSINNYTTEFLFFNGVYVAAIKLDDGSIVAKKIIN